MDTFHFKEILQSFDLFFLNHSSVEMFSGTDRYAPELEDFICFSQLHLNAVVKHPAVVSVASESHPFTSFFSLTHTSVSYKHASSYETNR